MSFEARPWNTLANSSRAAVSAALPVASGFERASRAAITTISRPELPGRLPITFTSARPSCVKRSSVVGKPLARKVRLTRAAAAKSPALPGVRSGTVETSC